MTLGVDGRVTPLRRAENHLANLPKGDAALPGSPVITIKGDIKRTPAQFRSFNLTERDIQRFCARIDLPDPLLLFIEDIDGLPHIVLGVVGPDNYQPERSEEIVYGRRWRVERHLSYSEILQTVLLAGKTALEHELRERIGVDGTTPFNAHQDNELMADVLNNGVVLEAPHVPLNSVTLNGRPLNIQRCHTVQGVGDVVCIDLGTGNTGNMPFMTGQLQALVTDLRAPLEAVWDALLHKATQWLQANLLLDGQAVFSPSISVPNRVAFSKFHRNDVRLNASEDSVQQRGRMNADIDTVRAPVIRHGPCNTPNLERLVAMDPEHGVRPHLKERCSSD